MLGNPNMYMCVCFDVMMLMRTYACVYKGYFSTTEKHDNAI